jgi:uncharacterized protein (TIGR04255 family)
MSVQFNNAPLVELIAEVRWEADGSIPAPTSPGAPGFQISINNAATPEEFYTRFGDEIDALEFHHSERTLPQGFAAPMGQVAYRFRKSRTDPTIVQVGPGVFTVNAVRGYKSWETFSPNVEEAAGALLRSRDEADHDKPFTLAQVRYLDMFDAKFLRGQSPAEFIESVLGFGLLAPDKVSEQVKAGTVRTTTLQTIVDTDDGLRIQLTVGEGQGPQAGSVMLDMIAGSIEPVEPAVGPLMNVLGRAHLLLHDMFLSIAKDLYELMEPTEVEE